MAETHREKEPWTPNPSQRFHTIHDMFAPGSNDRTFLALINDISKKFMLVS